MTEQQESGIKYTIENIDKPTRCIVHFAAEEGHGRIIYYQVLIDTSPDKMSPSGEFIRFNAGTDSEIHGWVRIEDIVIDEELEVIEVDITEGAALG